MLSDNRDFYDLCRKYKYYYNAYKEIEKLKEIYWSKYIQEAYNDTKRELEKVEKEIISLLFSELIDDESLIEIKGERTDIYKPLKYKVVIYDDNFVEKVKEYLKHRDILNGKNMINESYKKFLEDLML